jgi:MFS transporter, DHA1 family, multidrug resistance protein
VRRLPPESLAFTLLLGGLATLPSFAIDMALPVLPEIASSVGVPVGRAALTISVFMAGFALGPLLVGPLSDRIGRRPLLVLGCSMYAGFGVLTTVSSSLGPLLLGRFLMGAGGGACGVLVVAVVRDLFDGAEARVRQSYVNLASGIAPVVAPSLGVVVASFGGWRAIYGGLSLGGLLLLVIVGLGLAESLPPRVADGPPARRILSTYARVLRHRVSTGYALVVALSFAALFAYISGSSLLLIDLLHVSQRTYGLLFACTALGLVGGAFASARLSRRGVSHERLMFGGLGALAVSSVALLGLTLTGGITVPTLVSLAFVGFVGQGIVRPNAVQGAVEPVPESAGAASAVLSGLQMLAAALASALVAALFHGRSALPVTGVMAVSAVGAVAVYAGLVRPAERRGAEQAELRSHGDPHGRSTPSIPVTPQ